MILADGRIIFAAAKMILADAKIIFAAVQMILADGKINLAKRQQVHAVLASCLAGKRCKYPFGALPGLKLLFEAAPRLSQSKHAIRVLGDGDRGGGGGGGSGGGGGGLPLRSEGGRGRPGSDRAVRRRPRRQRQPEQQRGPEHQQVEQQEPTDEAGRRPHVA